MQVENIVLKKVNVYEDASKRVFYPPALATGTVMINGLTTFWPDIAHADRTLSAHAVQVWYTYTHTRMCAHKHTRNNEVHIVCISICGKISSTCTMQVFLTCFFATLRCVVTMSTPHFNTAQDQVLWIWITSKSSLINILSLSEFSHGRLIVSEASSYFWRKAHFKGNLCAWALMMYADVARLHTMSTGVGCELQYDTIIIEVRIKCLSDLVGNKSVMR